MYVTRLLVINLYTSFDFIHASFNLCVFCVQKVVHIKGEVQSRIIIISKERVKISLQIGAKIMKIG